MRVHDESNEDYMLHKVFELPFIPQIGSRVDVGVGSYYFIEDNDVMHELAAEPLYTIVQVQAPSFEMEMLKEMGWTEHNSMSTTE